MEKCPNCGNDMELSMDSMHTIHRCVLRFHCNHCHNDWDLSGDTQQFTKVEKPKKENPCEGCYSYGKPSAMERNCPRCERGEMRNKII